MTDTDRKVPKVVAYDCPHDGLVNWPPEYKGTPICKGISQNHHPLLRLDDVIAWLEGEVRKARSRLYRDRIARLKADERESAYRKLAAELREVNK